MIWADAHVLPAIDITYSEGQTLLSYLKSNSYGSGHVNPNAAADPGLIYDLNVTDYLNYPSFSIYNLTGSVTVTRMIKNVCPAGTYTATVEEPRGIRVKVEPNCLKFGTGEEKIFNVTFNVDSPSSTYVFGSITWSDGTRYVRSPVAVRTRL
ncbi:Subtilisin-like protease SBT5.4 [Carex littledalei]|uniref:Subtilisin-like protease SBT5.4 n=1 Tax=Carex littledalei TaxID=544730 RepID=A0A833QM94_9POAL|nr:Subtilisin-like protease SBT5.4 [Carex littledalei]